MKINQKRNTRKRLVSVRIDEKILNEFRSMNLNLSLTVNELLALDMGLLAFHSVDYEVF